MKRILFGAVGAIVLGAGATAGLIQSGGLDFAADAPHSASVSALIEWARERSLARAAADIAPPPDLADPARIRRGAGNYDAMCAQCHRSPGVAESEMSKGLYPAPPNLAEPNPRAGAAGTDARRFWIIKHGIKASGMPAWSKGGMEDAAIWDLVAFLKAQPGMTAEAYRREVEASEGHTHAGMAGHHAEPGPAPAGGHEEHAAHEHAAHDHKGHKHAH